MTGEAAYAYASSIFKKAPVDYLPIRQQ